jgi:MscS family membrane protein
MDGFKVMDPLWFSSFKLLEWAKVLAIFIICFLAAGPLLTLIMKPIEKLYQNFFHFYKEHRVKRPLAFLLAVLLFVIARDFFELAPALEKSLDHVEKYAAFLGLFLFMLKLADMLNSWIVQEVTLRNDRVMLSTLPLLTKVLKIFILALALVLTLQNMGINVTALITGLGIGGVAIAMAGQKTLEHLFGGVTLIMDKPLAVGDSCKVGDIQGIVEGIGIRSTRIRSSDRTIYTIPNGQLSQLVIENFGKRDRMRFAFRLGVRYETTPHQLRFLLVELRRLLQEHSYVYEEEQKVRLLELAASSIDIEVQAYIKTTDPAEFAAVREDLYLRIMDVVEGSGTDFAFPSRTVYMERAQKLNPYLRKAP